MGIFVMGYKDLDFEDGLLMALDLLDAADDLGHGERMLMKVLRSYRNRKFVSRYDLVLNTLGISRNSLLETS